MFKKVPVKEIFRLNDYVDILENRTLSSNLVSREDLDMEIFSLGKKEVISDNKIFKDSIYLNIYGDLELTLNGEKAVVLVGEGILIKKNTIVSMKTNEGNKLLKISFDLRFEFEETKAFLKDLLLVLKNQVANLTFANNEKLNLALISLDESEKLSTHAAGGDAFVYVLKGESEIVIDDEKFNLKPQDCIIMPKKIPHSVYANKPYIMLLIVLK